MDTRVLIFWAKDFPIVDTVPVDLQRLIEFMPPMESVRSVDVAELKKRLKRDSADLLINPYGSAFPEDAWPEILAFLSEGGSLLNLGGEPFSVPVSGATDFKQGERSNTFQRRLMIDSAEPVDLSDVKRYGTIPTEPLLSGMDDDFTCVSAWDLHVRSITNSGADKCTVRPLLFALAREERKIAAPVLAVDHTHGSFGGGRWVFASFVHEGGFRDEVLTRLTGFAAMGPSDFQVKPSFACFYPDERAALVAHVNRFEKPGGAREVSLYLSVRKDNIPIFNQNVEIESFRSPYYQSIPLSIPLSPGIYSVEARLSTGDPDLTDKFGSYCAAGFWCQDKAIASRTQPLSVRGDYLAREDRPSFLVGVGYTPADSGMDFLADPNPAVWHQDFAAMREAGINTVRCGLHRAFRSSVLHPGAPSEETLRSCLALLMTAAHNDMNVVFSLFDEAPESWGGGSPYTDRRSLAAQRELAAALAYRLSSFHNLMWDLIDQPVLASEGEAASHDSFRAWAEEISRVIRQNGNPKQLLTMGYRGRTGAVPDPQGRMDSVQFTSVHTNGREDVLWSALTNRSPGKPEVILETLGLTPDAQSEDEPWRALERKLVLSIGAGAGGVFEWSSEGGDVNGSLLGLHRTDRTANKAFRTMVDIASFVREVRPYLKERQPETACVVLPDAGVLEDSHSVAAARKALELVHCSCTLPASTVDSLSVGKGAARPGLIILPAPGAVGDTVLDWLISAVEQGSCAVVTGGFDTPVPWLVELGADEGAAEVLEQEKAIIFGTQYELDFSGVVGTGLLKGSVGGRSSMAKTEKVGAGTLLYAPLPCELAADTSCAVALYKLAMRQAGIQPPFMVGRECPDVLIRPLVFKQGVLYALVSNAREERQIDLVDALTSSSHSLRLGPRGCAMLLIDRKDGSEKARYEQPAGQPVAGSR